MINKIVLEDMIVLYWDRDEKFKKGYKYCIRYGKGDIAYTDKTHFTIDAPTEKEAVSVCMVDENNRIVKEYERETVCLPPPKKKLDVTKPPYNAVGDGKTMNTAALQRALCDCKANEAVYIPQGTFLTGALDMHSDTELYLGEGAILQGTANASDYLPKIKSRFEGFERMCYRSLVNMGEMDRNGGYTCRNVIVRGKGAILGGGRELMENIVKTETGVTTLNTEGRDVIEEAGYAARGRLINISNAQNVVIYGLELGMGASWNVHMIYSDNIVTAGCYIHSEEVNNGDGWDPDSSENCTIFDCDFNTRDDMVAIKSGKNPEGNIIGRPSRNIRVFDCRCTHGHGLAMGSEMSGGVDGVYIWDCEMENSRCGLEIKGRSCRGGYVRNVSAYNCSFSILALRSVNYNCGAETPAPCPPVFENYHFEDIRLTGVCLKHNGETWEEAAIIAEGFDEAGHELKNVTMKNITIKRRENAPKQRIDIQYVKGLSIENITCE